MPTLITPTAVTFVVPDAELDTAGARNVVVTNPGPGGGDSNAQVYTLVYPADLESLILGDIANISYAIVPAISSVTNLITNDGTKKNVVQSTVAAQMQFNTANAGYNNKGTIDGLTGDFLRSVAWTATLAQPATVIVVGNAASTTGHYFSDGVGANRQGIGQIAALNRLSVNAGTAINQPAGPTSFPKDMYVAVFNGASSKGFRGGDYVTPVVTGNAGAQVLGGETLGANAGGAGTTTQSIRMTMRFAGEVSTARLQRIYAYATRDCGPF